MNSVFEELKDILQGVAGSLEVTCDEPEKYDVYTSHIMKNGKPLWFGGVYVKKNYISYHLMPVYVDPELLEGISPELKKRMQGKSCFNFKVSDQRLFDELSVLTQNSFLSYVSKGYVSDT